jgi:hypothetical protein
MSDTTTETTPATPEAPATQTPPAQETDWKAEARKWEARAKENSAAATRLTEIEEASKTAEQKAAERLAELEAKVTGYETRDQINAWKTEVAEATGVPAALLAGSTKEEIEAHAAIAKPLITPAQQPAPAPTVATIGQAPARPGNVSLSDQIAAAEAAGNKALVGALKAMQLGTAPQ